MHSIPPANITLLSPSAIAYAAIMADFIPLAQTLLIVVDGVFYPHPAPSVTYLHGACPTPAYSTLPMYTSSTSSGSTLAD